MRAYFQVLPKFISVLEFFALEEYQEYHLLGYDAV
jgi:hypothetical protein